MKIILHQQNIYIKSSKLQIFILLGSLSLMLFFIIGFGIIEYKENERLRENDLKYRYIKITGGINHEDLSVLENIFNSPDNKEIIRKMYEKSTSYKKEMQKQIEVVENIQNEKK